MAMLKSNKIQNPKVNHVKKVHATQEGVELIGDALKQNGACEYSPRKTSHLWRMLLQVNISKVWVKIRRGMRAR
jgi:hypothetical protein